MSNRRILLSYAHPDDESFGSGGMISRYVAEGADVFYICATNGDVGTVAPEKMEGYNSVAELRIAELDCASVKLGFKEVFKFGYRDSGMMYSDTTKDPACLWQAPRDAVARRVVEVIRKVKPQVIVTFNKFGGYGHPDHIAIQRATTDAFKLAGDPTYETGQEPYQPQKLYYSAFSTLMFRVNLLRVRMRGENPRKLGRNKDFDMLAILENVEPIHAEIDVKNYLKAWDEASACHDSQLGGGMPRLPMWFRQSFVNKQSFTRVHPAPAYNRIDEYDLFSGVKPD